MGLEDIYTESGSNADEYSLIQKLIMYGTINIYKSDIPLGREWNKKVGWSDVTKYSSW